MASSDSYEIEVYVRDHWVADDVCTSERQARSTAEELYRSSSIGGVRIIRVKPRPDGTETTQTILTKTKAEQRNERVLAQPVEEAPNCETVDDCYGPDARKTVNRVMRQYIDRFVVTPTELIHNSREIRRVLEFETLVPSAVSRVAAVQTKDNPADAASRRTELFDFINQCAERAQKAAAIPDLPQLKDTTLGQILRVLERRLPPAQLEYVATVVLCRDLVTNRDWLSKLQRILTLIATDFDSKARVLYDAIIADIFGSTEALREILGRQPDLESALIFSLDLAEGQAQKGDNEDVPPVTHQLNAVILDPDFLTARQAMFDAIARQLKGTAPLSRSNDQLAAYKRVALRIVSPQGVVGGPMMAEALALAHQRYLEEGGQAGKRNAVIRSIKSLPGAANQLMMILALGQTELGAQFQEEMLELVSKILSQSDSLDDLAPADLPPKERLQRVTTVHRQIVLSALPDNLKTRLADKLDNLLARFIVDGRMIERLDDPSASLRLRAIRLVQICTAGVLTEPKGLNIARERIVAHLRQPNFDDVFVADLPDKREHERALRSFYAMLKEAGFN